MSTMQSRDAQVQEFLRVYELRAACNECTYRRSRISYSFLSVSHQCAQDLMLVKAKVKGHIWSPISHRPLFPRPSRYEVCWFFKEDAGCVVHRERCTFARSAEEAAVWNLQKQTHLDLKSLFLMINQTKKLNEQSRQGDAHSNSRSPSSYQEKLLEEYRKSGNEILILSEQVDDVSITHDQNLCLDCLQTDGEITWRFQITTERSLEHVALLKMESGAVFSLGDNVKNTFPLITHATGHHLRSSQSTYELSVCFLSFSPGVYEQWLVFDFDIRPVLLRKLKVRVGEQFHAKPDEEESECAENVWNERWNRGNRVIVPFFNRKEEDELELLLSKYKPPQMNLQFSFYTDHSSPFHQDNYKERTHDFLFREEIAEEKLISRLNVCGLASLSEFIDPWRLCATLKVSCSLTPDTPEGLMLKRGVRTALLKTTKGHSAAPVEHTNRVYAARVHRQAADEGHIVLELSSKCVSELQLKKGSRCEMEVQFQLDRLWFCQMHQAVDHLTDLHTVLPDLSNCCVPVSTTRQTDLNNKQQIALNFILGKCEASKVAAPLLIYGPFGTGKTHCLASAAIQLALQPKTKVLICTYTNSSADLYVRVHFHPYITNGHPNLKILRIKSNKGGAAIKITDDITRKYCLYSPDGKSFILPTRSHLESHRIIITTTTIARRFHELNLPEDFFSHILIDEASQMLECEAVMALGLADKHTRVVLAGDHMQMGPKLFSVANDKHSEHTLLNRLFRYYQDHSSNIAKKSRIIFDENYRSTGEIVDFVSKYFYVTDGIKAKGDVPRHPKLYPLMFHHVRGECLLNSNSMSWHNPAEVTSVVNVIQELVTVWPVEWGKKEPMQICVLSEGHQVDDIRSHLWRKGIVGISVQNLANIQGRQFRVIIITTVHTRDRLLQSESSCLEFFNDVHAVNTAITRAQSLVVVVGDAGALCCFGKCSRIWKSFIELCISKGSATPDYLTRDFLQQEVSEIAKFQRIERIENDVRPATDLILKEMIEDYNTGTDSDEDNEGQHDQKRILFSSSEKEDLLKLVRERPTIYRHGELVMQGSHSGYVIPYDKPTEQISIKGRKNIGMSFPGDEVVVETGFCHDEGYLGKVLGVTNKAEASSSFVCTVENERYQKQRHQTEKNFVTKIMIPISRNTTKICILVSKKARNFIPIWKLDRSKWKVLRHFLLDENTKKEYVFVVQIFTWKAHCSFPLGNVTDVLPIGTTVEEGMDILMSEFQLMPPHPMQEATTESDETDYSKRTDFKSLKTFTVDPKGARDLDDAVSVNNLGDCYELGVHVADVARFVPKGMPLDSAAKEKGTTFYSSTTKPVFMFPENLTTNSLSLLPGQERKVISFITTVEKESGNIRKTDFKLSVIQSKKQLTYEEAENIISDYNGELKFDTLEDCVRVAYHFARKQRKARLHESWTYAQPDQHRNPGEREANLMIQELNVMFNHAVADFLTKNSNTKLCTPLRCQLPPTAEQLEQINDRYTELIPLSSFLTYHIDRNRVDFRNKFTFTVYSPTARGYNNPDTNLRDAVSFSDSEYHFEIGVHKADPQSNVWSLIPGQNQRAISLILKVEKLTGKTVEQRLVLSSINSNKLLSDSEADSIINQSDEQERNLDSSDGSILEVYRFALKHKQQRQKTQNVDNSNPADDGLSKDSKCMLMIEELNLMFKSASEHLIDQATPSPNNCPVKVSPELERRIRRDNEELGLFQALEEHLDSNNEQKSHNFIIVTSEWNKIESAALTSDFYKMTDLISADDIHPQLHPVIGELRASLDKAFFIRAHSCEKALVGHYSLDLDSYTYASSPIRRYIDVVLQRLMHSVLDDRPVEYSQKEIDLLCDKSKRGEVKAQEFERKAESLRLAVSLHKQSTYKLAFVTVVEPENRSFKLSFPFDKGTYPDKLPVLYSDLHLKDQPVFDEHQNQMRLTWKKRRYSMRITNYLEINLRFCSEIQQSIWHAIVEAVREEHWEEAKSLILAAEVTEHCETDDVPDNSKLDPNRVFTSEKDHYIKFALCLKAGDPLQVQLTSERERGYLAPTVQLLSVRSNFEICVEHTHSPIKCFSKHANHRSKPNYHDVKDYVEIWKPLCEMESAQTAVDDSDCVVIEEVNIDWEQSLVGTTLSLSGSFILPVENIKKWEIEFDLAKCFLCIRKRVQKPNSAQSHQSDVDPDYFTWVAHGVTTQCLDKRKNKSKIIHFNIKYASMKLPKFKRDSTFTVEVIPKLLPDIRKESAVNSLTTANELVKNIALGHRIRRAGSEPAVYRHVLTREPVPQGLPTLNESQLIALEQALKNEFTLIQGPPGTGKTVVGAYIVYWFSLLNSKKPQNLKELKDKEKKEVILYCGPSNKSVDVVAEYLLRFGDKLKQLRVYSRQMEMLEFPYPGSILQLSQEALRQERSKPELRDITLHHRIRGRDNPCATAILDFDIKIEDKREKKEQFSQTEIEEYKKLLNAARLYELQKHDVILCTCTAAASPNLTKSLNARQIIIDECAMATEPQTLVPLVSFKPEKVVLLGDHKQLRPIVKNEDVRRLGMTHSLFERYMSRAFLLDTQYRMHPHICKFPSEAYYQSKLKTQVDERASMLHATTESMRQSKHILFGDIRGVEISLVVPTARGNVNSKTNLEEVEKAIDICTELVSVGCVSQENIAILSPYNSQVAQIKENIGGRQELEGVTVTTISKSQGSEWRYVILSMVRSCPSENIEDLPPREWLSEHIGFVGDENQINVGITRAQDGLCILGNQELLNCSPAWRKLLKHYKSHGCVVPANQITIHNVD